MGATELQALLRFLSQDAKVPLAIAIGKVKDLQNAHLDSVEQLAKAKATDIQTIFPDEKLAKQTHAAAKRVAKKRAAGDENSTSPSPRKKKKESLFAEVSSTPAEIEAALELPCSNADDSELSKVVLFTNRAPLVLAFVVTLLRYTMPEQPLSSRLSLAQGYVSVTSKARALNLGIETGRSAEEEGYGEGYGRVSIMGKEIRTLKRWGYEWKNSTDRTDVATEDTTQSTLQTESQETTDQPSEQHEVGHEEHPALWGLDLEALKKSGGINPLTTGAQSGTGTGLPIHTPQSARAYLFKSFDSAPHHSAATKKPSAATKLAEKERNLGQLLRVLDMLYESWADTLSPTELDSKTWGWYVRVRPDVAQGAAGWGGKNEVKLAEILSLRRTRS